MRYLFCIAALGFVFLLPDKAGAAVFYRVSGISDLNLPTWSIGDPGVSASIDICAYTLLGNYNVTVSSPGGFVLTNGANTIPYTLKWEDSGAGNLGSSGGSAMTNNVALVNRLNANSSLFSNDCSTGIPTGPTARLYLNITQAAMNAAPAGTYSGTITLLIGP